MKVKVLFHTIHVNIGRKGLEIIFKHDGKWYRMNWDKVPEKFKVLYVARLKILGIEIPKELRKYERNIIDLSNLEIELDLNYAEEVPEMYPL